VDKKDWIKRALECRMDENLEKPRFECLICPYGKNLDFSDGDDIDSIKCNVEKLTADFKELFDELK
jgi:hypothetical protein